MGALGLLRRVGGGSSRDNGLDAAASKGDTVTVRRLLSRGVNVNDPSSNPELHGRRPLHAAVSASQVAVVEELIAAGADVDATDNFGGTPLHYAVGCPHSSTPSPSPSHSFTHARLEVLHLLLRAGADYSRRDKSGRLPVHIATHQSSMSAREALLSFFLDRCAAEIQVCFFEAGQWQPCESDACRLLGFEMAEGAAFAALRSAAGHTFIVDFVEQVQFNVSSLFCKSISWRVNRSARWNRPSSPSQGLHPASQDPRLLARYLPLLHQLRSQGVEICPIVFDQQPSQQRPLTTPTSSSLTHPPPLATSGASTATQSQGLPPPHPPSSSHHPSSALPPGNAGHHSPDRRPTSGSSSPSSSHSLSQPSTPLVRPPSSINPLSPPATNLPSPSPSPLASLTLSHQHEPPHSPSLASPPSSFPSSSSLSLPRLLPLRSGSSEYNEIAARFVAGMERPARLPRTSSPASASALQLHQHQPATADATELRPVTVTAVQRIAWPGRGVARRTDVFEEAVRSVAAARGGERQANVRAAWHGASKSRLLSIVESGFEIRERASNGWLYGRGVYLAPEECAFTSAEFALPDSSGQKHMLLCRVVLGSMEVVPFESSQQRASSLRFDTGTDSVQAPTRYVVWEEDMNEYILPTHLLSFQYC